MDVYHRWGSRGRGAGRGVWGRDHVRRSPKPPYSAARWRRGPVRRAAVGRGLRSAGRGLRGGLSPGSGRAGGGVWGYWGCPARWTGRYGPRVPESTARSRPYAPRKIFGRAVRLPPAAASRTRVAVYTLLGGGGAEGFRGFRRETAGGRHRGIVWARRIRPRPPCTPDTTSQPPERALEPRQVPH